MDNKTNRTSQLYERFHKNIRSHRNIADETNFTHGPLIKKIQKHASDKKKILNIGCGTGSLDFYLASQGKMVDSFDISKRAITSCRKNAKLLGLERQVNFTVNSIERFETNKKYDLILLIEVIEHIKNDKKVLTKVSKLLKKDGLLILSTPSLNAPLFKLGFLDNFDRRVGHLRRYDLTRLKKLISELNLQILKCYKEEGLVRNFLFTSTLGSKVLLRLVNRSRLIQKIFEYLDYLSLIFFGESDLILICEKK